MGLLESHLLSDPEQRQPQGAGSLIPGSGISPSSEGTKSVPLRLTWQWAWDTGEVISGLMWLIINP